jgi:hypothetical protein
VLAPEQAGIHDAIAGLLGNTSQLDAAVQTLCSSGLLIRATSLSDDVSHFTVDDQTKKCIINTMSLKARVWWTTQVLMLVTFIFPRPSISQR